jgi:hypothetical protein
MSGQSSCNLQKVTGGKLNGACNYYWDSWNSIDSGCKKYFGDQAVHDPDTNLASNKDGVCNALGFWRYMCDVGDFYMDKSIDPNNHLFGISHDINNYSGVTPSGYTTSLS